jgi:hypothetical protein
MDADDIWQRLGDVRYARPTLSARFLAFVFGLLFCRDALAGRRLLHWGPRTTPR